MAGGEKKTEKIMDTNEKPETNAQTRLSNGWTDRRQ
jgi:hypothetical protein